MPAKSTAYSRVLLIAPSDNGLDVTPEVDALADLGYTARLLQGIVTADRIFQSVRMSKYAVLHFACHAGPQGVLLSNGQLFDIDAILQVAKMADALIVFLNGCETSTIGQTLVDEGVPIAIVAMKEIRDDLAKQTSQAFYKSLAESGDPHIAYKDSKPATRGLYQFLVDGGYQELILAPVLKRLEEFALVVEANNTEHASFRSTVSKLNDMCGDISRQRTFFLQISIAVILISLLIQTTLTVLSRGGL